MKINIKKLIKKIIIIIFIAYVILTLNKQQKTLNTYKASISTTNEEIYKANEHKDYLISLKEEAHSLYYIEKIARDKLNMYLPGEKVYIDVGS